jgi:glycosyltransferase involved in cell wall biosynthesis
MPEPLPNLAVTIVCCNNEATIGRTIESVRGLAAQVIAVDSGSTDSTIDILRAGGAEVVHQDWLGFVGQKQFALERCDREWVLHLDSDESLEPELIASVREAVERDDPEVAAYEVNRKIFYAGRMLNYAWQPEWRLRLARRERAHWTGYDPHDTLAVMPGQEGRTDKLKGDMRHDAIPSIAEFLARQVRHSEVGAQSYLKMGRKGRVRDLVFSPVGAWVKQVVSRRAYKDGWRGYVAASATAAAALMKHAILLEKSRGNASEPSLQSDSTSGNP